MNKPVGITSFDVIRAFKKAVHPSFKIGHGGTLDPFASGVLLLLLGKATKRMNELTKLPKTYRATAILGSSSDTLDCTGQITKGPKQKELTIEEVAEKAKDFVGTIEQQVPDYSAAKVDGKPRYLYARQGKTLEQKTKPVTIDTLEIESIQKNKVIFTTKVSSGTYIRQLSYDLFRALGIESYLSELTRTAIGEFSIEKCATIEDIKTGEWRDKVKPLEPLVRGE